jgi:Fic family protein
MQNDILSHIFPPNLDSMIWSKEFALQLAATQGAISGLNQAVPLLHNPNLLMQPLLDKEAESSSRLEGTQASVEDVYKAELKSTAEESNDVTETKNYRRALNAGVESIKDKPLNQTTLRGIHEILMTSVRGEDKHPGKYRSGDVWIGARGTGVGQARYVPPAAMHLPGLMSSLEAYIQDADTHPLIACGVIHQRFEGIHPFEDGNGRTGRLLITLYLLKSGMLTEPMLYPSGFFEKNKRDYMDALHTVDIYQDWSTWLLFFLRGIETQALLSLKVAREIDGLFKDYRDRIKDATAHIGLLQVLEFCFVQPIVNVRYVSTKLQMNPQTVRRYLVTLADKKILTLDHLQARGERVYANRGLLDILRQI